MSVGDMDEDDKISETDDTQINFLDLIEQLNQSVESIKAKKTNSKS